MAPLFDSPSGPYLPLVTRTPALAGGRQNNGYVPYSPYLPGGVGAVVPAGRGAGGFALPPVTRWRPSNMRAAPSPSLSYQTTAPTAPGELFADRPMLGPELPPGGVSALPTYVPLAYDPWRQDNLVAIPPPQGVGGEGQGDQQEFVPAPEGVDAGWYQAFQKEHGETPEAYYRKTGEGLAEALADREWGDGFARENGRPPTEWEWEEHWYSTRSYGRPGSNPGPGWRRKSRRGATPVDKPRPPVYVPQPTVWRK